jgi:chemotaxis regulatin CheY-phosphate phosphatase CheZ
MGASALPIGTRAVERLPDMLLRAHDEVCAVLASLRASRDMLQKSSVHNLRQTSVKLQEVTDATEVAATGILDGLDRSIALVDGLEKLDTTGSAEAQGMRDQLRDELFQAQGALQFQDITAQQLSYASSLLAELEERMAGLANALEPDGGASQSVIGVARAVAASAQAFDPNATMANPSGRQALADSIFSGPQ